jgi:hypothetical protein
MIVTNVAILALMVAMVCIAIKILKMLKMGYVDDDMDEEYFDDDDTYFDYEEAERLENEIEEQKQFFMKQIEESKKNGNEGAHILNYRPRIHRATKEYLEGCGYRILATQSSEGKAQTVVITKVFKDPNSKDENTLAAERLD